ncbi:MAG TPA: amino acid adenylation domain-containing protein, partial [Gemmatimonadota bacterium]|nr:amino acid adenylation domain-containing protein [Gemmatimonadota bacterium]
SGDPTFRTVLERVRRTTLAAQERQEVPFERLVEELHPERDGSHNPFFQVSFTVQGPPPELDLPGLEIETHRIHNGGSKFDLSAWLWDDGRRIRGFFEHDTALFDRETVRGMVAGYRRVLEGAVSDPDAAVSTLPILDDETRRRLIETWNDTEREPPDVACVHEMFEAQVARTPDAVAIESLDGSVTYRELDRRAEALADRLRARGAGPGVPVALLTGRSPAMVVALLAVLKSGSFYVPLDPTHPDRRLAMILEEVSPAALLTERELVDSVPRSGLPVVLVDGDDRAGASGRGASAARPGPDDLAYLIYTSGSTGRPKGVEIRHRSAVNFLADMAREPGLGPGDRVLAHTTLSFDISLLELVLPLTVGATTILADAETAADGRRLRELVEAREPTLVQGTPATWRLLIAAGWAGAPDLTALSGGETLPPDLARELLERTGELWNVYGPTEATVWATRHRVRAADGPVPIGRPIANTQVYVLDGNLRPVPAGVPGELCIGGLGVARGYRDRPDLTAERFVPDPFGHGPGDRLYRTGDVARWRHDGTLEFLGRRDHQVKVRGFRIELGEVESALRDHPAVAEVVASVHEISPEDTRLVAHFVPVRNAYVTGSELREHARSRVPDYMVPRHFVEIEEIPLTPNGKVERGALPDPFRAGSGPHDEKVPPRTDSEKAIADIWREILGCDEIGVHDTFYDLGGHSLLAIKALDRIE